VLAVALFSWATSSRRLEHSVVTPAMFFVTVRLLFGPEGTCWITLDVGGHELRAVAEVTLTLVLFTDASRLDLRALRQDYPLPARLLGVGLPLTIVLGTLLAKDPGLHGPSAQGGPLQVRDHSCSQALRRPRGLPPPAPRLKPRSCGPDPRTR
jgi:hypothetical protein